MPNINKEKLVDIMKDGRNRNLMMGHIMGSDIRYFAGELVKNDVVPVVRCKDCKFYEETEYYHPTEKASKTVCRLFKRQMQSDDFCSYGERKEGANSG